MKQKQINIAQSNNNTQITNRTNTSTNTNRLNTSSLNGTNDASKFDVSKSNGETVSGVGGITNGTRGTRGTKKIINWSAYDKALQDRGDFSVLLNITYLNQIPQRTGKAGHPVEYTDAVILFLAQLREFMQLPIRQTLGMARFILRQAHVDLSLPSRTTLSRRLGNLGVPTNLDKTSFNSPIIFMPDSTGLKVSGEGEWKVKKHGADKHRKWVKVHLAVDYNTRTIISFTITDQSTTDNQMFPELLKQAQQELMTIAKTERKVNKPRIESAICDGAYDDNNLYKLAKKQNINLIVPPPHNAIMHVISSRKDLMAGRIIDETGWEKRNKYVKDIMNLGKGDQGLGRKKWKKQIGYHKRSLVETAMCRLKRIFGSSLKSRSIKNQITETKIRISLLNLFTSYGLPEYT